MSRRLLPIALLLVGIAALGVLIKSRPEPKAAEVQEKVWIVQVAGAKPQSLGPTLTLYARVESPRTATLRAAVNADVVEVKAREGHDAAKGEMLVELDPRDARWQLTQREADVAELRAELDNESRRVANDRKALKHEMELARLAKRGVERVQRLATRDLGSESGLDIAREALARQSLVVDNRRFAISGNESRTAALNARLQRAQSFVSMARLDLERTAVSAPFAGRIAIVNVAPGDRVRAGDALLDLFDANALELRAQVPSRYLARLRDGLRQSRPASAHATVGDTTLTAHLDRLGAQIERGRAGADALFIIDQEQGGALELGRTVELAVSLPIVDTVVPIPAEALYGVDQIYLLRDSRMHAVTVKRFGEYIADDGQHRLLVKSAQVHADDQIIITQLPSAVDGLKVRIAK
jgi:multidrug resistance efflux pump